MKNNDIEKAKKEGFEKRMDFEENRDGLEEKFHVIYKFLEILKNKKLIFSVFIN